ncbi:hypothetical protein D9C10_10555 [Bacillus subtilis subsp. subtilis]|nr:hypothetical protein D9C10_10555 [Bacillus subtilis subsp. subtilis]
MYKTKKLVEKTSFSLQADCRSFRQFFYFDPSSLLRIHKVKYTKEDFSTNSRFLVCQISFLVEKQRKT